MQFEQHILNFFFIVHPRENNNNNGIIYDRQ